MEFKAKKAIYLQIADYVYERILLNEWLPAHKVPSVRELAVTVEVNPNTVMRTYTLLEQLDIIKMQRGIGFFVTDTAVETIKNLRKKTFLEEELPQIFNTMKLLDVSFDELKRYYQAQLEH